MSDEEYEIYMNMWVRGIYGCKRIYPRKWRTARTSSPCYSNIYPPPNQLDVEHGPSMRWTQPRSLYGWLLPRQWPQMAITWICGLAQGSPPPTFASSNRTILTLHLDKDNEHGPWLWVLLESALSVPDVLEWVSDKGLVYCNTMKERNAYSRTSWRHQRWRAEDVAIR